MVLKHVLVSTKIPSCYIKWIKATIYVGITKLQFKYRLHNYEYIERLLNVKFTHDEIITYICLIQLFLDF